MTPDGLAVTLQNGLDNGPKLTAAVGAERAAVGVTYTGAMLLGPGEARHTAQLPNLIGTSPADGGTGARGVRPSDRVGLSTHVQEDIEGQLWAKALANAAINPLTALWRVPNGALLTTPDRREMLAALVEEAAAVIRARGITLPFEIRWPISKKSAGTVRPTVHPCSRTLSTAGRPRLTASTASS